MGWSGFSRCLSLILVISLGGCSTSNPIPEVGSPQQLLERACNYLWAQQAEDGGWHSETHGLLRSGQALTPFVLFTLLKMAPDVAQQHADDVVRAIAFIRSSVNEDGVVGLNDPDVAEYPNYSSAFAVRCLVAAGRQDDRHLIERICLYLQSQQFSERRGFGREHPVHGAWGFGGPLPLGGSPGHVDISYTRHVLEALRDADAIDSGIASRAQLFLKRMQRDGGFYFSSVVEAANKGESNPSRQEAQHRLAEKRQRDRVLNLKIEEEKKQRATAAQVRSLIQENKVAEDSDGQPFHFEHEGSIKSVFVSEAVRKDLADGRLAIAKS
ncbi:MAG: hypothetical protein DSY92_01535, partial [Planctomycetota bacterium]